jgi:uncharacterized protein YndB with AHSA1/START domain
MNAETASQAMADNELLIVRSFDAPLPVVFQIWAQQEHMIRWLGPRGYTCTHVELDFRTGGTWRACIESKDSGKRWMGGKYREIEPNRRIVCTFAWEDGRDQPGTETVVTVTFSERNGKTVQSFHQAPFVHIEGRDAHIMGWNLSFDNAQAYVERLARGETT